MQFSEIIRVSNVRGEVRHPCIVHIAVDGGSGIAYGETQVVPASKADRTVTRRVMRQGTGIEQATSHGRALHTGRYSHTIAFWI